MYRGSYRVDFRWVPWGQIPNGFGLYRNTFIWAAAIHRGARTPRIRLTTSPRYGLTSKKSPPATTVGRYRSAGIELTTGQTSIAPR
jgi:hypothetical protein